MGQSTLVGMQIQDGQKLIERLVQEGFDVTGAGWVREGEEGQWYLYVASKVVENARRQPAYRRVHTAMQQMPEPFWVDTFDVKLVRPSSPLGQDLVKNQPDPTRKTPTHFPGGHLGNMPVEEAFIYAVPKPEEFKLTYPLFAVNLGNGYEAIESAAGGSDAQVGLAIFTRADRATEYMAARGIQGRLTQFSSAAAFHQFLQAAKLPITGTAFNPKMIPGGIEAEWYVSIREMMEEHLPQMIVWDYPLLVIQEGQGYASISGQAEGRGNVTLVCAFTDTAGAGEYMERANVKGVVKELKTPDEFMEFLQSLSPPPSGIILDPTHAKKGGVSKWCVPLEVVMRSLRGEASPVHGKWVLQEKFEARSSFGQPVAAVAVGDAGGTK